MKKNHELGALIASIQERNGWSDRDLQQRAEALGLTALSKSNFSRWRTSPVNSIKGSNIRDMAAVLGISEAVVARAALESMGVTMQAAGEDSLDHAIALDVELSARDKHIVRAVLDALRSTEEMTGHGHAAPISRAGKSSAEDLERRGRPAGDSALAAVSTFPRETGTSASAQEDREREDGEFVPPEVVSGRPAGRGDQDERAVDDASLAEMLPHADHEQYPAAGIHEGELSRWRRERDATPTVVAGSDSEEVPGQEGIPVPDEVLMAGYDEPQESILARQQQDEDAEGLQETSEEDYK